MGAPGTSTWADPVNPRRPGQGDFNGIGLIDDAENPPDPETMPTAELLNTQSWTGLSAGMVIPNATVSVTGGTSPTLAFVTACNTGITLTSSTLTLTRVSIGNVWITWPAATFPAQVAADKAFLNAVLGAHSYSIAASRGTYGGNAGVQVTTTVDGALADVSFTLDIM